MMHKTFLALALMAATAAAEEQKVTPVQKVIQLLEDMVATGTKEKQDEEIQFNQYSGWCARIQVDKRKQIKKGNEAIETLEADIQKYEADADLLAQEIAALDVDISTWQGDEKSARRVRDIERKDYENTHKDYTESMEALDEGIQVLEKQNKDVAQAEGEGPAPEGGGAAAASALMQLKKSKMVPLQAKRAISAFLQMHGSSDPDEDAALAIVAPEALEGKSDKAMHLVRGSFIERSEDTEEYSAPEANAYENQSQGVIDMLQHLYDKFFTERETLEKVEVDNRHAFDMLMQDLKNQIDFATTAREEKKEAKSKLLQGAANAKGDLADTTGTRDDDVKYLADTTATCTQKAEAYEQRQKMRAAELVAVNKAIEIMSGAAVKDGSKHQALGGTELLQKRAHGTALAQLRSASQSPTQVKVAAYLKSKAQKFNSRVLAAIATRVEADPFKKVKKMIKDLVVKLMEEANEEADHKGWCDMELATNEKTRTEKSDKVVTLTAEIDELEASVAKLGEDLSALTTQVAELDAAVAKATALRTEEKEKNQITIKDSAGAQKAVSSAIGVLKEFYDKASQATALMQTSAKEPEVFGDEPYQGMGGQNGGVMGMMEVIQADFERLESETKSAEAEAAKEYDEFMQDSRVDKAMKEKDIEHKSASKQDQEHALTEKKADLAGTQKELDAALTYYDKLKPDCIAQPEPYEDRVARRKEEIESLQEALRILQGEDVI